MQDAAIYYAERAESKSTVLSKIQDKNFVLATIHRQENTDHPENLRSIIEGLNDIHKQVNVVVPLHPRTRNILRQSALKVDFQIIDPVGYFDMIMLLKHCLMVITDSGGVQKEAFFFGKHCITLREQTEWVELVENGYNRLAGSNQELLLNAFDYFKEKKSDFGMNLYGGGEAAEKVAGEIIKL
jgi:UDP-GlcNAc3NAcA epimerase